MSKSVDAITFSVLRDAMKTALVPGTGAAKNKNDLIELMCNYDCEFVAQPHPVVRLANKQSLSQPAVTDGHAATQPEIQTQKSAQAAKVPKHVSKKPAVVKTMDSTPLVIIDSSSSDENVPIVTLAGKKAAQAVLHSDKVTCAPTHGHMSQPESGRRLTVFSGHMSPRGQSPTDTTGPHTGVGSLALLRIRHLPFRCDTGNPFVFSTTPPQN
jgi:hypothetical protein